jgi:hypothetical protein
MCSKVENELYGLRDQEEKKKSDWLKKERNYAGIVP